MAARFPPGNSPGTLTLKGNLTLNNGSKVLFEGGDLAIVGGTPDLNSNWTLILGSGFQDGGSIVVFEYGTLASGPDLVATFDISGPGFDPGSPLTLSHIGGQIILNGISYAPEPAV